MSGFSNAQASRLQAQIAQNNSALAGQNAFATANAGEAAQNQAQMKTRAVIGATKAAQAANGIDVNTGSAVDVRASEAELGKMDAMTIRSNAARQAYGYQVEGVTQRAQSKLLKAQATQAEIAGVINAGADLLGGSSSGGGIGGSGGAESLSALFP